MPRKNSLPNALNKTPNPNPFSYADYVDAKNTLTNALKGPCFYALLTGPSGMGKTELLRDIEADLDKHRFYLVYLAAANISTVSIVNFLAVRLHIGVRRSYLETVDLIAEMIHAQTVHMMIWFDEADQLKIETLQQIRTLAEHKLDSQKILSVVFSGLPELATKLETPVLFPLKRRIIHRCTLNGLRRNELELFLEHRFGSADAQRIPTSVYDDLFERTQATPALIDQVCRHALAKCNKPINPDGFRAVLDTHGL